MNDGDGRESMIRSGRRKRFVEFFAKDIDKSIDAMGVNPHQSWTREEGKDCKREITYAG